MVISSTKELQLLPTDFAPAERKPIEEIQHETNKIAANALVQYLLDAVPNAFLILNEYRQIIFANEAFLEIAHALHINDIAGMRVGEVIECIYAYETAGGCGTSEYCRQCGAARAIVKGLTGKKDQQECRVTTNNGNSLDLLVGTRPFTYEGRNYLIFTAEDIAHEKRRQALENIFFHDVLNTAGIVSMYAQLLDICPEEIQNITLNLGQITNRLVDEITRQKDLLRAENHELASTAEEISVLNFIQELAAEYRNHPVAKERHIEVRRELVDVKMTVDPVLLGRVISNMIKNALEAVEPDGVVTLWYEADENANTITFNVHNNTYIPKHVQSQIFQRSFSTKGMGRGLGTYSMRLLSEQYLSGRVHFTTSQKNGTTFHGVYPLHKSDNDGDE